MRERAVGILREAIQILEEREASHGEIEENLATIASIYDVITLKDLGYTSLGDVLEMMIALKLGRIKVGDHKRRDHYVDAINYMAFLGALRQAG